MFACLCLQGERGGGGFLFPFVLVGCFVQCVFFVLKRELKSWWVESRRSLGGDGEEECNYSIMYRKIK